MKYGKHALIVLFFSVFLTACQNKKEDNIDIDQTIELAQAQAAFHRKEYETAVEILMPLAHEGNADAQYALGYCLFEGLGVQQNRQEAYFWIQESALGGNSSALLALEIFEIDPHLPEDGEKEIKRHLDLNDYHPTSTNPYPNSVYENEYQQEYESRSRAVN